MTDKLLRFIKEHFVFLIVLSLIPVVYSNILHAPPVLDDQSLELQHRLKELRILKIGFRHITNLSLVLNKSTKWGLAGFHLFNILLHVINVILFYHLCNLTLNLLPQQNKIEKTRFVPLFAATLFALHPIQTAAVTYVTQRATILATLFCLCSLLSYIRGVLSRDKRLSLLLFYPASLLFLLLGLMSKEQAIVFPVIILLYDLFFLSAFRWKKLIPRLIPVFGIFAFIGFIAVVRFNAVETLKDIASIFARINTPIPFRSWTAVDVFWTPWQHVLTEFRVVGRYLTIIGLPFPSRMVFDFGPNYPISTGLLSPVTTSLSILFFASLLALSIRYAKKYPLFSFGILFYLIAISLESFVAVGSDLYFEHRNYLPSMGIFLSMSFIAASLLQKVPSKRVWYLLILIPLSLSLMTYNRNTVWQSRESLWLDTLKKAPNNKRAMTYLGQEYIYKGKYKEASDILLKSLEIKIPTKTFDFVAYSNLLKVYSVTGKKKKTTETMNLLEELSSDRSRLSITAGGIYYILGNAYFTYGDIKRAREYLQEGLSLRSGTWYRFSAYILLGQIELRYHRLQQAQNYLEKARLMRPDSPIPLLHLGDLYYMLKDAKRAEELYREAIKRDPRYFKAYLQLGQLYIAQKEYTSAKKALKKALHIRPNKYRLLVTLGNISFSEGDIDSSIDYFSRAVEIGPDRPTNYFNLGECYIRKGDNAMARKYFLRFLELAPEGKFLKAKERVRAWLKVSNE